VVTVGAIVGAENGVQSLREIESLLNIRGGHGHGVTRLVARSARTAIAAHALEEWPGKIDPAARGAVSLRRPTRIREKRAVRDKSKLLSANPDNGDQRGNA
jgi:hypothetical protein